MSTNCNIILQVPEEYFGKTLIFNSSKLPIKEIQWDSQNEKVDVDKAKEVCISTKYIGIYCHWDGYLSGVGETLMTHYTDFDTVLNLILGGDCSIIDSDKTLRYATRTEEKWENIAPRQVDNIYNFHEYIQYLYKDNAWYYLYDDLWIKLPEEFKHELNSYITGFINGLNYAE